MSFQEKVLNRMPLGISGTYSVVGYKLAVTKKAAEDIKIGSFVGLNDKGEVIQVEGKVTTNIEVLGVAMLNKMINSIEASDTIKAGQNVEICVHGGVYKQIDEAMEIKAGDTIFIETTTGDLKFSDTASAPANSIRTGFTVIDGNKDATLEPSMINIISQRL